MEAPPPKPNPSSPPADRKRRRASQLRNRLPCARARPGGACGRGRAGRKGNGSACRLGVLCHVVRKEAEISGLGEGGSKEGRSEERKAGKGGRKRTRGREVLEELGALPAPEVEREGGASPFLLPGEVPASRGGSGPSPFSFSLRIDVLLLTREEAAAAEDGVAESVNSALLLGGGTGR